MMDFRTFNIIKYKNTNTEYVTGWKLKGVHNSNLKPLNSDFLPKIKYFNKKIGLQFIKTPLVVQQSNYASKIVNVYIVYDWFRLLAKNSDQKLYVKKVTCLERLI